MRWKRFLLVDYYCTHSSLDAKQPSPVEETEMSQLRKKFSEIAIFIIVQAVSLTFCGEPLLAQTNSREEPLSTKDWIDFVFRLSSTSFALFTLWKGLERYKIDQTWKRAEFVVEQIQNFESDPENKKRIVDAGLER
ncbi:hypothetical protein HC928_15415 [bacterium]|nr:hypothetical protein [bacterium]